MRLVVPRPQAEVAVASATVAADVGCGGGGDRAGGGAVADGAGDAAAAVQAAVVIVEVLYPLVENRLQATATLRVSQLGVLLLLLLPVQHVVLTVST